MEEFFLYLFICVFVLILWAGIERTVDFFLLKSSKKAEWTKEKHLPALPDEEKITLLKYDGLEREIAILLRLYYHSDGCKRILFYRHKGHVTAVKERLILFDEEELCYSTCYGVWMEDTDGFYHIYEDEKTALKEWEKELSSYHEEPLLENAFPNAERR